MRILIGDTETTGLGSPPQVMACEVALIEVDEDLNVIADWETLVNPGVPIEESAASIHGITNADVTQPGVPTIEEAFEEMCPGGFKDVVLICHNVKFDRRFLSPHMEVKHELCTLELSRRLLPNAPNHRLGTLKTFLGLSEQAEHEAMGDIATVLDLLRYLVPLTNRTITQLINAAAAPVMVYTMPFGKHKGQPIQSLDSDYRNWLLQQDIGPDLRYTLTTLQKAFV